MKTKCWSFVCIALSAALFTGCGGETRYNVSGKVTIKGKGALKQGQINLDSSQNSFSAQVKEDGSYTVKEGVLPGDYKVSFTGTTTGGGYDKPDEPVVKTVADKYDSADTTDLKAKVDKDTTELNFELEPAGAEAAAPSN